GVRQPVGAHARATTAICSRGSQKESSSNPFTTKSNPFAGFPITQPKTGGRFLEFDGRNIYRREHPGEMERCATNSRMAAPPGRRAQSETRDCGTRAPGILQEEWCHGHV